jgi:hypothetical protein
MLLILSGCVKDKIETPVPDRTAEYFPLVLGKFISYAIDSIVIDDAQDGNVKDTVTFQLKEELASFQVSVSGDTLFYIHRFRRNNDSENWQLINTWVATRNATEATRTEENLKFRKLTFPLHDRKQWMATSYIPSSTIVLIGTENIQAYQEWESEVTDIDTADQVGNFSFVSGEIMHVSQTDTDDGSTKRFVLETYARNIGLVQRTDTILDSRCNKIGDFTECLGKPWLEHAGKGYVLSQVMIDHN